MKPVVYTGFAVRLSVVVITPRRRRRHPSVGGPRDSPARPSSEVFGRPRVLRFARHSTITRRRPTGRFVPPVVARQPYISRC